MGVTSFSQHGRFSPLGALELVPNGQQGSNGANNTEHHHRNVINHLLVSFLIGDNEIPRHILQKQHALELALCMLEAMTTNAARFVVWDTTLRKVKPKSIYGGYSIILVPEIVKTK